MSTAREQAGVVAEHDKLMRHHRAAWRVERIGWSIFALILGAALFGAFGYGPLSRTRVGSPQTFVVEYDRLQRSSAPTDYGIEIASTLVDGDAVRVRVDTALLHAFQPDSIVPAPRAMRVDPRGVTFEFDAAPGDGPLHVDVRFRPATFGRVRGDIAVEGAPAVTLDQYVYP